MPEVDVKWNTKKSFNLKDGRKETEQSTREK